MELILVKFHNRTLPVAHDQPLMNSSKIFVKRLECVLLSGQTRIKFRYNCQHFVTFV